MVLSDSLPLEAKEEPSHVPSRYLPRDYDFGAVPLGRVGWEVEGLWLMVDGGRGAMGRMWGWWEASRPMETAKR